VSLLKFLVHVAGPRRRRGLDDVVLQHLIDLSVGKVLVHARMTAQRLPKRLVVFRIDTVGYEVRALHIKFALGKNVGPLVSEAKRCPTLNERQVTRQRIPNRLQMVSVSGFAFVPARPGPSWAALARAGRTRLARSATTGSEFGATTAVASPRWHPP